VEGNLTNTASVDSPIPDPDQSDDSGSVTVIVEPPDTPVADLGVEKIVDDADPETGQLVTYTVTLSNAGPSDATGVVVDEVLPEGLTYVAAEATQGTYDASTGAWDVGDLAVDEVATLTVDARVTGAAGTTIDNIVEVSASDQADPDGANDAAEAAVEVLADDVESPSPTPTPTEVPSAVTAYTGSEFGRLTMLALLCALLGLLALLGSGRLLRDRDEGAPPAR